MDASQITPEAVESVEKLLKTRGGSFEPTTAKRASAACAPLAAWVRANLAYAGALARVRPLQVQQAKLHKLVCFQGFVMLMSTFPLFFLACYLTSM